MRETQRHGETVRSMGRKAIRVLLAEPEPTACRALERILDSPGLRLAGVVMSDREAIDQTLSAPPDVLVLNARLPDMDAPGVAWELRQARSRVPTLWLYDTERPEFLLRGMRLGVKGFVHLMEAADRLPPAVRALAGGDGWIEPALTGRIIDFLAEVSGRLGVDPAALDDLNDNERQALRLLALGKSNRQIGSAMDVTEDSAKLYVRGVLKKLNVSTRTQAALAALWLAPEVLGAPEPPVKGGPGPNGTADAGEPRFGREADSGGGRTPGR